MQRGRPRHWLNNTRILFLSVETVTPLIACLNDLVFDNDLLVSEAYYPGIVRSVKLFRAELALDPTIQVVYAVRMHSHRRQNLESFRAVWRVERDPTTFIQPEGSIENPATSAAFVSPRCLVKTIE